jgi:ComF family protein
MLGTWVRLASQIARSTAELMLPSHCVACNEALPLTDRHASCCNRCWNDLPALEASCRGCAAPLPVEDQQLCIACGDEPWPTEWTASWGNYRGGLERLLHAFKFERHDFLDEELGTLLAALYTRRGDLDFDCAVPIPMHPRKVRARGYNQAELLARRVSSATGLEFLPALLQKTSDNATQSLLPREERAKNVRRVFRAHPSVKDRAVLLVDDICTTGETIRAASGVLLAAGARRVAAITVARA